MSATAAPTGAAATPCAGLLAKASQTELAKPVHEFDQDEKAGWRALATAGCTAEAAVLVERYLIGYESNLRSLKWHQAQLLAMAGQDHYPAAIAAARQAINPLESVQHPNFKWNAYVLASIAFWDHQPAEVARQMHTIAAAVATEPMNQANLDVVRGLQRCQGQPYKLAYDCRAAR